MPRIRLPHCPLLRSPFAAVGVLLLIILGGLYLWRVQHDRRVLGPMTAGSAFVERNLWDEYGLATLEGTPITEGAQLPAGTRVRCVRLDGTQPAKSQSQFTITISCDVGASQAATVEEPPNARGAGGSTEWGWTALPLGAVIRFDRPGRVQALVIQRDISVGLQKPMYFTIIDSARAEAALGASSDQR